MRITTRANVSAAVTTGVELPAMAIALIMMIVDDEPQVLKVVKALLEYLGCDVASFADSQEAAECLEKQKYDGLVLDARMPRPDGFDLTRHVRASRLNGQVPIIMLTGYADMETMRQAFRSGITFFLGKPLTVARALTVVNAIRGAMFKDKRRHPRVSWRQPVRGRLGRNFEKEFAADSVNVCEDGILLEWADGVNVGEEIELEFKLPRAAKPVQTRAKVVRKGPPGHVAAEFIDLAPEGREAIRRFVLRSAE